MPRKHWPLLIQLLLFLLVTSLSVATGIMTNNPDALPVFLRRGALPLAGITVLLVIVVMVWQHRAERRPTGPAWDLDRSIFPGLEAFTEQDSAVFFDAVLMLSTAKAQDSREQALAGLLLWSG